MSAVEPESFEAVYRRLHAPLVRLAHLLLGGGPGAEDVVHDAFVRYRARHGEVVRPDAYLRRAVANACTDAHRRAALERERARQTEVGVERVTEVPELDETWRVLRQLPDRQRAAIVLRYYEDLTEADIAQLLGCRPGTVKSLLHRGLSKVKEVLT